jgi:hypothetical protein
MRASLERSHEIWSLFVAQPAVHGVDDPDMTAMFGNIALELDIAGVLDLLTVYDDQRAYALSVGWWLMEPAARLEELRNLADLVLGRAWVSNSRT